MSGWVVVYAAVAAGLLAAWLIVRKDRYAEVIVSAAPPEGMDPEAERRLYADEREVRLAGVLEFAAFADADPALRQGFVDLVLAQTGYGRTGFENWQVVLWELLVPRLRPASPGFWPGMDLHTEARLLHDVDLRGCEVRDVVFRRVRFDGDAHFDGLVCTGLASFQESCFARHAFFGGAAFGVGADFDGTTFTGTAAFPGVTAGGEVWFDDVRFSARADFTGAEFAGDVTFTDTGFAGRTSFRDARFTAEALFAGTRFSGPVDFTGATAGAFRFRGASARADVHVARFWPAGVRVGAPRPRRPGRWAEVHGAGRAGVAGAGASEGGAEE
jgi:uncharacterized protein YjbI with pentapeptide repeats